ncbi:hypothetical protein HOLDEFILI_03590 [Holdemania filiformis DSM 12042]|uniref:Uncharacterized protein n=1 Tax=Holdemania filiformis DSM 12042 TaxID=545696 RepID=B9YCN0_9FIRM|nr:hypothetical protein HOLDEFILI_03590 [Holdemania filiformis DSM 12042]
MINNPAHAALPLSFFYIEQFYRLLLQKPDDLCRIFRLSAKFTQIAQILFL